MKIRFAILIAILSVAGVFLILESKFTLVYQNGASFLPVEELSATGSGRRIEVSFDYERQKGASSNQVAVWIEDADGNLVRTIAVTQYTSTRDGVYGNPRYPTGRKLPIRFTCAWRKLMPSPGPPQNRVELTR